MNWADIVRQAWSDYSEGDAYADPVICEQGGMRMQERLAWLASVCASLTDGDLVEIGAYEGLTTMQLVPIAKRFRRRVIAIDPWDGVQVGGEIQYERFQENLHGYEDVLSIVRQRSQDATVVEMLKSIPLCFVFVDGLHSYEAVQSDLAAVGHCGGLVAVDDCSWNEGIRRAVRECGRDVLMNGRFREAYVLPKE